MQITPQHLCREFDHRIAQIDDGASGYRAHIHPVFRVRELDLQAAQTVEEDGQAAEVGVFAYGALVGSLGGSGGMAADETGVAA